MAGRRRDGARHDAQRENGLPIVFSSVGLPVDDGISKRVYGSAPKTSCEHDMRPRYAAVTVAAVCYPHERSGIGHPQHRDQRWVAMLEASRRQWTPADRRGPLYELSTTSHHSMRAG